MNDPISNHVVIAGTGRAGTTFLIELLTVCGIDTGFNPDEFGKTKNTVAQAGLEFSLRQPDCPFLVKDPDFFSYADEVFERKDIKIDHVFIPIRDVEAAAESRRNVSRENLSRMPWKERLIYLFKPYTFDGGVWVDQSGAKGTLESTLMSQLYELLLTCSKHQVPVTMIHFPKLIRDKEYLYDKLSPILQEVSFQRFAIVFDSLVKKELVHQFNENDV